MFNQLTQLVQCDCRLKAKVDCKLVVKNQYWAISTIILSFDFSSNFDDSFMILWILNVYEDSASFSVLHDFIKVIVKPINEFSFEYFLSFLQNLEYDQN